MIEHFTGNQQTKRRISENYLASPVLELVESSGVDNGAFLPNPPSELRKINEVAADSTFVADNSGYETDDGEGPDD